MNPEKTGASSFNSDRFTKQLIIATLCLLAGLTTLTICALALQNLQIPVEVKDLTTYITGVLSGMLAKTGLDTLQDQPIPVTNAGDKLLKTEEVTDSIDR
jgi:hypothetical protein